MSYYGFGFVCLIIHIVINIDIFRKKPTVNLPAIRSYRVFVVSVALYFLCDILWGYFDEAHLAIPLYIDTAVYFIAMGFTVLAWAKYTSRFLESKGWFDKVLLYSGNIFFLAEIVLLIVNFFTPVMFSIDQSTGTYTAYRGRNIMLYIQFALYVLLAIYIIVTTIRGKTALKRRSITIAVYSLIMATAITIQIYHPLYPVYAIGLIVGSTSLNSFVISDIKDEYKSALEGSRVEVKQGKIALEETKHMAYTDPLTGIKNKHAYVEEEDRIDRFIAQNKMPDFAVIVFDLNGLKHINDTQGHDAGDAYIIESVQIITHHFGDKNLFRFGGDEFVIILEGEDFENRSKKLNEFERFIDGCLDTNKPVISSGMSRYRRGTDNTYHAVFGRADKIMYARKDALKEHRNF